MVNPRDKSRKGDYLRNFGKKVHILCLQEMHGLEVEVNQFLARVLPHWKIFHSACVSSDGLQLHSSGGIVIAICPELMVGSVCVETVLVPGRCLAVSLFNSGRVLSVFNTHNFGLDNHSIRDINNMASSVRAQVVAEPTRNFACFVGDLNFSAPGESKFVCGRLFGALTPAQRSYIPNAPAHERLFMNFLGDWTEIVQPHPTRYDHKGNSCSRIDRGWFACPSSLLIQMQTQSFVVGSPEEMFGMELSDHAPVVFSIGRKPQVAGSHSLPKFICTDPRFKEHLNSLVDYVDIFNLPLHRQLPTLNSCIQEAGKIVRQRILFDDTPTPAANRLILASVSRAIWFNNVSLAKRILRFSSIGNELLAIVAGVVSCPQPMRFDELFNQYHKDHHGRSISGLQRDLSLAAAPNLQKQIKGRLRAARRMINIYWPRNKRLKLIGIRGENGAILSQAADMQAALKAHWAPVYAKKEFDSVRATAFLQPYLRKQRHLFQFEDIRLPTEDDFIDYIGHLKHSTPGMNGIPYAGYQACPIYSARVMRNTTLDLSLETPATNLRKFNQQLVWFSPKAASDDTGSAVTRTASSVRTIFGGNSDCKVIAGAVSHQLVPATLALTPWIQRGFCRGRQLSLNNVDIDMFTRVYNNSFDASLFDWSNVGLLPCTALYDFCNAFPTLLHDWLFLVLLCIGVPTDTFRVIRAMYTDISAYSSGIGECAFLFFVLGGAKTGCPLSSLLFLLGVNPIVFLFLMLSDTPKFSTTRICADDFGSALRHLNGLKTQASIFRAASAITGLHLKPSKCVLIVSCVALSDFVLNAITNWINENVPDFKEFRIQCTGKYLGWHLGLDSETVSFRDPLKKFKDRVLEVAQGLASATSSIIRYNQRAVTVLSYVAQFAAPPVAAKIQELDAWSVHKILRLPAKCMPRNLCHTLEFCTLVNPIPLRAYCNACRFRFAHSERDYLLELARTVAAEVAGSSARVDQLPIGATVRYDLPHGRLGNDSILCNLLDALYLKGDFDSLILSEPDHWLASYPIAEVPAKYSGLQAGVLNILSASESCHDLETTLCRKIKVTLGFNPFSAGSASAGIVIHAHAWFPGLCVTLKSIGLFIRVCWFKTIIGGWCTSDRLHLDRRWPCVLGCPDCLDEIHHYLICPVLWQFGREALNLRESSIAVESRLCLCDPSSDKLRLLAFVHCLYHHIRNDDGCFVNGDPACSSVVQYRARALAQDCKFLVADH